MTKRCLAKKKNSRLPLLLCFAIPFLIACIGYAILGLYPVGDRHLLAHDEWHQYYPFFVSFRDKLLNGGSLQYSWDVGMGLNYSSLFAYYLASPLYLFSVLVPQSLLREYYAFLTILQYAFAGLFFGIFLKTVFRKVDLALPFFALMYTFCAWRCGYAWNTIWLDAFTLLPLLIAGTVSLLREGRFRMYVLALALTLWCNYYIAYFCCIFVLLCFMGYCLLCWKGMRNFLFRFVRIGLCTLLAFGLTAVLLLPTLFAMQTTNSAGLRDFNFLWLNVVKGAYGQVGEGGLWELLKTETLPGLLQGTRQVLNGLLPGTPVNKFDDNFPNIFCSFSAVILALYGLFNRKIRWKEKIFHILLLLFLLLSFLIRGLDYFWHGFHFPNMLYFRFSFLFSFVLIAAAYRSYTQLRHSRKWSLLIVVPAALLLVVNYCFTAEKRAVLVLTASLAVIFGITLVLLLYRHKGKPVLRQLCSIGLCLIIFCEMLLNFGLALSKVGTGNRSIYPREGDYVQALLDYTRQQDTELFYRTEVTNTQTLNDAALNGYYGVSVFTSSANVNFSRFSRCLGLSSWPGSNRYSYYEAMPLTNTLCGIKYLVDREGAHYNTSYNRLVASSGKVNLLENEAYIALGFMTEPALGDFVAKYSGSDAITDQNEIFALATGLEGTLYTTIDSTGVEAPEGGELKKQGNNFRFSSKELTEEGLFTIRYVIPQNGLYCATAEKLSGATEIIFYRNGEKCFTRNIKAASLFTLGDLTVGDEVEIVYEIDEGKSGTIDLQLAYMDKALFDEGLALLADEPWVLTEFSDTKVKGTVEVKEDGLFYTSVPYTPGWKAYVDGKEVPLAESYNVEETDVKLTDGVVAFPLTKGSHEIELRFRTPGLLPGAVISLCCLLILILLLLCKRRQPVLLPDRHSRKEFEALPEAEDDDSEAADAAEGTANAAESGSTAPAAPTAETAPTDEDGYIPLTDAELARWDAILNGTAADVPSAPACEETGQEDAASDPYSGQDLRPKQE